MRATDQNSLLIDAFDRRMPEYANLPREIHEFDYLERQEETSELDKGASISKKENYHAKSRGTKGRASRSFWRRGI